MRDARKLEVLLPQQRRTQVRGEGCQGFDVAGTKRGKDVTQVLLSQQWYTCVRSEGVEMAHELQRCVAQMRGEEKKHN